MTWAVIAWQIDGKDPYRPARGVCSAVVADGASAVSLAHQWARVLASVPRLEIEVVPPGRTVDVVDDERKG